jgi:hypothetical protein
MKWIHDEKGPACFCGRPTFVFVKESGEAYLICLVHEGKAGALFPLPVDGRPDEWPNLVDKDVDAIMVRGQKEFDLKEAKTNEQNKYGLS